MKGSGSGRTAVFGRRLTRRNLVNGLSAGAAATTLAARTGHRQAAAAAHDAMAASELGAPIVTVPGAFLGGWHWQRIRPLLWAAGHPVITTTPAGVGERAHLATPETNLDTHIRDVVATLESEDLRDVILVGHSAGGVVITGVADHVPERIGMLVYLDGLIPEDGQSIADLTGGIGTQGTDPLVSPDEAGQPLGGADGFFRLLMPDATEADIRWTVTHLTPQPRQTFTQPIRLTNTARAEIPRAYLFCTGVGAATGGQADPLRPFADRARSESGWTYREVATGHTPYVTAPEQFVAVLLDVARRAVATPPAQ